MCYVCVLLICTVLKTVAVNESLYFSYFRPLKTIFSYQNVFS